MNLVLTGGIPAPVSPAKAAPALLSPGMLPSLPPTNIPPPPAPNTSVAQMSQNLITAPNPSFGWENPALYAQQQAQMIAQQSLLARQNQAQQAQNEHVFLMNHLAHQHNLAVLNNGPLSPNHGQAGLANPSLKPPMHLLPPHLIQQQHPLFLLPQRVPLGMQRGPTVYHPSNMMSPPGLLPLVSHVGVKRSYGDAFTEQTAPAKRAFHPPGTMPVHFQPFYPNI